MKNFRISNQNTGIDNIPNWKDVSRETATDVTTFIKESGWNTFEIEWKTPVTKEYAKIIEVVNNEVVYVTDVFKIPTAFKKYFKVK